MSVAELSVDMKMGDIMEALPGAKRALFARYHLGGCSSCAFSDTETLAQLASRAEIDAAEVLEHLLASHQHDETMLMGAVEAKQRMDAGEKILLVDVRTREEHEAVVIPGSQFFTQETQQQFFALLRRRRRAIGMAEVHAAEADGGDFEGTESSVVHLGSGGGRTARA